MVLLRAALLAAVAQPSLMELVADLAVLHGQPAVAMVMGTAAAVSGVLRSVSEPAVLPRKRSAEEAPTYIR
jgi:hypothetical protein